MNKKVFLISLLLNCVLISVLLSNAVNAFQPDSEEYLAEREEVISAIEEQFSIWGGGIVDTNKSEDIEDIDYDELIRIYCFKGSDRSSVYSQADNFGDMIDTENPRWVINTIRTGNQAVLVKNNEGKWEIILSSNAIKAAMEANPDTDYSVNGIISKIESEHPSYDRESLIFVSDSVPGDKIIAVFTDEGTEYAACYFLVELPNGYEYENAEIMESSKLIANLAEAYASSSMPEPGKDYGNGVIATDMESETEATEAETVTETNESEKTSGSNRYIYIGVGSAAAVIVIIIVAVKLRPKKKD